MRKYLLVQCKQLCMKIISKAYYFIIFDTILMYLQISYNTKLEIYFAPRI